MRFRAPSFRLLASTAVVVLGIVVVGPSRSERTRRWPILTWTATASPTFRKFTSTARTPPKRTRPDRHLRRRLAATPRVHLQRPGDHSRHASYNLKALNDDYQDARVLAETKEYVELEVIAILLTRTRTPSSPMRTGNKIMRA